MEIKTIRVTVIHGCKKIIVCATLTMYMILKVLSMMECFKKINYELSGNIMFYDIPIL